MIRGLELLCQGDNAQRALENLAKAKEEIRKKGENNGQFHKLSKYESIANCIKSASDKSKLTVRKIAKATGIPEGYIKSNLHTISLYALTPEQIDELYTGKGKYASKRRSEHTIPFCSLPPRRTRHFASEMYK